MPSLRKKTGAKRLRLQVEMNVVAELIEQCVAENARIALDQTEYQKKYDADPKLFYIGR
jgi:hypothetical protein